MTDRYILDPEGNPKPEPDLQKWAEWLENKENRILRQDHIGDVLISTVFLAIDHSFSLEPVPPVLWETMIFGGEHDQYQERYTSREDAEFGHRKALEMVDLEAWFKRQHS